MAASPASRPSRTSQSDRITKRLPLILTAVAIAIVAVPAVKWWHAYRRTQLATDLLAAIKRADVAGVDSLLRKGADPCAVVGRWERPLITAEDWVTGWDTHVVEHRRIVCDLLDYGGPVDPQSDSGKLRWDIAAAADDTNVLSRQLAAGAPINLLGKGDGWTYGTAVMVAAQHGSVHAVDFLLERGADPNVDSGDTALLAAVGGSAATHHTIVSSLIRHGANVNGRGQGGRTALLMCACLDDVETARLLLSAGADVNLAGTLGWTSLHIAADRGDVKLTDLFIRVGARVNARASDGFTALHSARSMRDVATQPAMAATLGADFPKRTQQDYDRVIALLLAAGAKP